MSKSPTSQKSPGRQIPIIFAAIPISKANPATIALLLTQVKGSCSPDLSLSSSPRQMTRIIPGLLFSHMIHLLEDSRKRRRGWSCFVSALNLVAPLSLQTPVQLSGVFSQFQHLKILQTILFSMCLTLTFLCAYERCGKTRALGNSCNSNIMVNLKLFNALGIIDRIL